VATQVDIDLGSLDPGCLRDPIERIPTAASALETWQAFHGLVETDPHPTQAGYDQFHLQWLASRYRILEWEIFIRDLSAARLGKAVQYSFASHRKRTSANASLRLVLPPLARFALLQKARQGADETRSNLFNDDLQSFAQLRPERVTSAYPRIHDDLFALLLANRVPAANTPGPSPALLIEDGELTFYSLLWLLRRAVHTDSIEEWLRTPSRPRPVRFVSTVGLPAWANATLPELLEQCGLVLPQGGLLQPTERWYSYCEWLGESGVIPRKDVQPRAPGDERFVSGITAAYQTPSSSILRKDGPLEPADFFDQQLVPFFLDPFGNLIRSPDPNEEPPGGEAGNDWKGHDHSLFRYARPSFLPWEFLLRSWQPFATNLLIIPLGWSRLPEDELRRLEPGAAASGVHEAPYAVAYVTIAGNVPRLSNDQYRDWVAASWTGFRVDHR